MVALIFESREFSGLLDKPIILLLRATIDHEIYEIRFGGERKNHWIVGEGYLDSSKEIF